MLKIAQVQPQGSRHPTSRLWTARMAAIAMLCATTLLAGCLDDDDAPYVAFDGGGFIFNYRIAEAFYGVNLRPMRRLDKGTVLEAAFENPAGGPPIIVSETVAEPKLRYTLRTPPVHGVKGNRDYRVTVQVRAPDTGEILATYEKTVHSDLDQSILPKAPLTFGPGYARPPPAPQ